MHRETWSQCPGRVCYATYPGYLVARGYTTQGDATTLLCGINQPGYYPKQRPRVAEAE